MTLTQALNTAQAIFSNTGVQSNVVSNNIANAGNANYNRRDAVIATAPDGATVIQISRSQEPSLQRQFLGSSSIDSAQERVLQGLEDLQSGTVGGNDNELAPATYLSAFQNALQTYAAAPSSATSAGAAVTAAQDLANSLNNATASVQDIRENADKEIKTDVDTLNNLLSQFKTANDAVISATASGTDSGDALDQRDSLLSQISQLVGIKTVTRANGDMAVYTSSGSTLFETLPRTVTFTPTNGYNASDAGPGNSVYIDGVPLAAGQGSQTTGQGSLQALLQIRDDIAPTYQSQLDEIARGLVTTFSETGTTGTPPTTTTQPGLFAWSLSDGTPGDTPAGSSVVNGIAGTIHVAASVITSQGGDPSRLRDGTINPASTGANPSGDASYSDLLDSYDTALGAKQDFDPSTGLDGSSSILDYAANSVGWLEDQRSGASAAADNTSAALTRSSSAYSNATGVNLDEELTLMMDIEQSYKAGTKILNAVSEMLDALLQAAS